MARVVWSEPAASVLRELPVKTRALILQKTRLLRQFPRMYPVQRRGRFRRHRRFLAGDWLVFYRVVGNAVYVRGLWPARIP